MPLYARGNPARWWKSRSCGSASRAPAAMFISPFRRLTSAGTLALLLLIIFSVWYITNPKRIVRLAEVLLSNILGGKVTVKSAHLSFSGTLLLSGVELRTEGGTATPAGPGLSLPIFTADQIEARFDWISLLSGQLHATQLAAIRPTLYLVEDRDAERWNYEKLRARPASTQIAVPVPTPAASIPPSSLPVIVLRDARVQWAEVHNGIFEETARTIIDGQLTPDNNFPSFYRFQISQRDEVDPNSPEIETREIPSNGTLVSGTWDVASNSFFAVTQPIALTDKLLASLPRQIRQWCTDHSLKGKISQLRITFDNNDLLVLGVDLDHVSMNQILIPEPWLIKARQALGTQTEYNLPLENVSGTLTFGIGKPGVKATNMTGRVLGFYFQGNGDFRGASPESPFDLNIRFPAAVLGDTYPPLFNANRASQDLLQRVDPHGKLDLSLSLKRLSWNGPIFTNGNIVCHDASMRFAPFPYPLDHINGSIDFNEQSVIFNDVTAWGDENFVHISGITGANKKSRFVDFKVWSDDCVFDDRLGACLPLKLKPIWDQFSIKARGSFVCTLNRDANNQGAPDVKVDVHLTDGSGYARSIPYRFSGAKGHLVFAEDTLLDNLTLTPDPADHLPGSKLGTVILNGIVKRAQEGTLRLNPEIKIAADVPADRALLKIMPIEYAPRLKDIDVSGRVTLDGVLRHESDKPDADMTIAGLIKWTGGSLVAKDQHLSFHDVSAETNLQPGHIDISHLAGTTAENLLLEMSGPVDLQNSTGNLKLTAIGDNVAIPADVPSFLPATFRDAWKTYKPSGTVAINANLTARLGTPPTTQPTTLPPTAPTTQTANSLPITIDTYSLKLTAKNARIAPAGWPESVDNITGEILASPAQISMQNMTAKSGPLNVTWHGDYQTATSAIHLTGSANSQNMVGNWNKKLPTGAANFLQSHQATGIVQMDLTHLDRAGAGEPWRFAGSVTLAKLNTLGSPPVQADQLRITGAGGWEAAGLNFNGDLSGTNVTISGKTVDSLSSKLLAVAKEHSLSVVDIDGKAAEGNLQGNINGQLEGDGRYKANLVLSNASLASLLLPATPTEQERQKVSQGTVSATLAVQQTFGQHGERTGRGELIVHDGKIYNLPLAMGLMQIVTLRLPVASAFNQASMSYYLRDDKVTFERILLESPGINLAGLGSMSLNDKSLDMNFVTLSPNEFQIPFLTNILQQFRNQLLEISVTGTIENPKVIPVPLNAIGKALQVILPQPKNN